MNADKRGKVLVTGGAGFLGSHTTLALLEQGYEVAVVDNLSNSSRVALSQIEKIAGSLPSFHQIDICDEQALRAVFEDEQPDAVIHFAAYKAVGEAVAEPLKYYHNNVGGLVSLLDVMRSSGCLRLVFSSSATVYGDSQILPFREDQPRTATNPYGHTKIIGEQILEDLSVACPEFAVTMLRYFNPVGAHPSGQLGEDPRGVPANLMPYITQVALGRRDGLKVFGSDYDTVDGSGVRDYLHVMDLAEGHVAALQWAERQISGGLLTANLGTGKGASVVELIRTFEEVTGITIPFEYADRRPGDVAASYACVARARDELQWEAQRSLSDMCRDALKFQQEFPNGYEEA